MTNVAITENTTTVQVTENVVTVTAAPGVSSDTLTADIATHNDSATAHTAVAHVWTAGQEFQAQVTLHSDNMITSSAPSEWWWSTGQGTFNGHADDLLMFGYNINGAGAVRNAADYAWWMGFERDYYLTVTDHMAEWYLRYNDSGTARSPFTVNVYHNTHAAHVTLNGEFNVLTSDGLTQTFKVGDGTGLSYIYSNLNIEYSTNATLFGPSTINASTGAAAISGSLWGQDNSTRYLSLSVFGSGYSDANFTSSAAFYAQSGLTNGLQFIVVGNAPLKFATNSITRLTIAGTGAATFSSSVAATSFDAVTGSGDVVRLQASVTATGFNNNIYWQRTSDSWITGRIGQNYTGSGSGYGSRLVFGINRGNNESDIVQALSLAHNGTSVIINMAGLPTSAAGLTTGDLYVDTGVLKVA